MELVIKSPKKIIWDVEGLFQAMEYMMPGNTIDKRRKYFIHMHMHLSFFSTTNKFLQ